MTCVTAIADKKIMSVFSVSGVLCSHLSLLWKLISFLSLVLSSPGINSGREKKLTNNYMWTKRFLRSVIYLFCCQGHLKHFSENFQFCRNSGNEAYSSRGIGGWEWGVGLFFASLWHIAYEKWHMTYPLVHRNVIFIIRFQYVNNFLSYNFFICTRLYASHAGYI